MGLSTRREFSSAPGVAGAFHTAVSGVVPVRLTGATPQAPEETGDGCATLQPTARQKNEVWSWDFVHDATTAGEAFRCLTVKDEATCFCVASEVARAFSHQHVRKILHRLVKLYGAPRYIRRANGPELRAQPLLACCERQGDPAQPDSAGEALAEWP